MLSKLKMLFSPRETRSRMRRTGRRRLWCLVALERESALFEKTTETKRRMMEVDPEEETVQTRTMEMEERFAKRLEWACSS